MAKKVGLKIGVVLAVVVGGYFLVKHLWGKAIDKLKGELLANGELTLTQNNEGIHVVNSITGELVIGYEYTGHNMAFPLAFDPTYTKSDNVAKLQAYMVFENPSLDIALDGKFGVQTQTAVEDLVSGLSEYGYNILLIDDDSVITEEFYNQEVIPELAAFVNNQ